MKERISAMSFFHLLNNVTRTVWFGSIKIVFFGRKNEWKFIFFKENNFGEFKNNIFIWIRISRDFLFSFKRIICFLMKIRIWNHKTSWINIKMQTRNQKSVREKVHVYWIRMDSVQSVPEKSNILLWMSSKEDTLNQCIHLIY